MPFTFTPISDLQAAASLCIRWILTSTVFLICVIHRLAAAIIGFHGKWCKCAFMYMSSFLLIPADLSCALCLQFVNTLETNILTSIGSLVNVTITNVVLGSISVSNTIAFTDADSLAAAAGQTALAQALSSGDVSLFGTTFGSVTVSNVKQANATNPGEWVVSMPSQCRMHGI